MQFYTHISDQYAPFHTKVINATVRDATHVLDGLLYNESDLRIEEHHTDTAGFTDHVFALMHLLGFRFAPRIRDLADKRLYIHGDAKLYPTLAGLIGGNVNVKHIRAYWDDILRLAASIKQGTVTASLMPRKLGSYPRQNGLAIALWNTVYPEREIQALRDSGLEIDESLLPHLSPLGWEHINLTGDYIWRQNKLVGPGRLKFRPLRTLGVT